MSVVIHHSGRAGSSIAELAAPRFSPGTCRGDSSPTLHSPERKLDDPSHRVRPDIPSRSRLRIGLGVVTVALVLALAVVLTRVVDLSGGASTVARLTYENPTDYALDVEVGSGRSTGWTSAGHVGKQATAVVEEIVDQGDVWVFRFDSQGQSGGELRLTRAALEASGWKVVIPTEVGRRLADAGAPPTP